MDQSGLWSRANHLRGGRDGDGIALVGEDAGRPIRWRFVDIRPAGFTWQGARQSDDGREWTLQAEFQLTRIVAASSSDVVRSQSSVSSTSVTEAQTLKEPSMATAPALNGMIIGQAETATLGPGEGDASARDRHADLSDAARCASPRPDLHARAYIRARVPQRRRHAAVGVESD